MRCGLLVTPINWHLTAEEAAYIIADCGAPALVTTSRLASVVSAFPTDALVAVTTRITVDDEIDGFDTLVDLFDNVVDGPVPDEHDGGWMLYSSGTTGKPKGILPPLPVGPLGAPSFLTMMLGGLFGFTADTVYLSPAPLYHAAPAGWTTGTQRLGGTAVVMERFDPESLLAAISAHYS